MISFERSNEYNNINSKNFGTKKEEKERNEEVKFENDFKFKKGKIEFNNYSLKYKPDGKLILKDMIFTINSGEKKAVMGRTGSGKSTLIYAITRIIESFRGRIIIDDIDISSLPIQILRKNIGVLSQNIYISEGIFLNNLGPLNKYSEYEIKEALKKLDYWYIKEESKNY